MRNFIIVTNAGTDKQERININYIVSYRKKFAGTVIEIQSYENSLMVRETIEEIDKLIEDAQN